MLENIRHKVGGGFQCATEVSVSCVFTMNFAELVGSKTCSIKTNQRLVDRQFVM